MDLFQRYGSLLKADGTNQLQRTLPALEKGYIAPDERSLVDLAEYARRVAAQIRFYSASGQPIGDWSPFLEALLEDLPPGAASDAAALEVRSDWPPHIALFLVFLKLFGRLQGDLNELPARHLRHYYQEILQLKRRPAAPDALHVVFELARNAAPTRLPSGTLLDAGKDDQGRALGYRTEGEMIVTAAQVVEKRRMVAESDRRGRRRLFVSDAVEEEEGPSWHTFGRRQLDLDQSQRFMAEADLGFAISSPVLRMAEGERTLRIIAQLRTSDGDVPEQQLGYALIAELTGAEGWVKPENFEAQLVDNGTDPMTLEMSLVLGESAPAIVAADPELHPGAPRSQWPAARFLVKGETGSFETLDRLLVDRIEISAAAMGVRNLVLQNDQGSLIPEQPMQVFGPQPRIGSTFLVGSAEVFSKKLSTLSLRLEWLDVPEDLFEHYSPYFFDSQHPNLGNLRSQFQVDVDFLYDRIWRGDIFASQQSLFGFPDPTRRTMTSSDVAAAFGDHPYSSQPGLIDLERFDSTSRFGFLRLVLRGPIHPSPPADEVPFEAFGHKSFSRIYASRALALARGEPATLPNEPYTPTLASIAIDYTASAEVIPGDTHSVGSLYALGPWGYVRAGGEAKPRLVPELEAESAGGSGEQPFQGALFLGVKDLVPPANVSLLFQIDAGTAGGTEQSSVEILESGETEWSFLSGPTWKPLTPEAVLEDGTRGFQQPGLVVLSVDRDASLEHTAMPSGLVWLRALVRRPPESAARTLALHAQSALARFAAEAETLEEYEGHLRDGLAPATISRLRTRQAAIKSVSQPYGSFRGRGPEADEEFFRRSSERLRHRQRAVTPWDFERLVLEEFPEVFKVKCLAHSDAVGKAQAGDAALVIVPDLRSSDSTNLLEPRAGAVLISRISDYVGRALATPFATVHVIHPVYERIRVDVRVAFAAGRDPGFYANQLNQDLRRFLSPWAFEDGRDIVFGARIYKSEILAFMEGREYVDHLTDFQLYHSYDGPVRGGLGQMEIEKDFVIQPDPDPAVSDMTIAGDEDAGADRPFVVGRGVEVAQASRPNAILVSHAQHRIIPVSAQDELCPGVRQLGVGYLTVGLDFGVHAD